MIETITYNNKTYPKLQAAGFAAQFAFPFAKQLLFGQGYDIGCNRLEWALPGSRGIDKEFLDGYDAYHLPEGQVDYIFSSHCLEHLPDWVAAIDYWETQLKEGGILFLYLPNMQHQEYWRPWHNRKHIHYLTPEILYQFLVSRGWKNVFITDCDLNYSFYAIGEKA